MKSVDEVLALVRREVERGRAWRAKEVLGGQIAGGRIEPRILEEHGRVLDLLGDRVEAGKYLFLSGARKGEYSQSIELFKQRHGRRHGRDLVSQFPAAFRRQSFDSLDAVLRGDLLSLGVTADAFGASPKAGRSYVTAMSWRDRMKAAIFLAVLLILFFAMLLGLQTMVGWLRK